MYKKICPKCHQPSFRSYDTGTWICPICQNDLTKVHSQNSENRKPDLHVIKKEDSVYNKITPYIFKQID